MLTLRSLVNDGDSYTFIVHKNGAHPKHYPTDIRSKLKKGIFFTATIKSM